MQGSHRAVNAVGPGGMSEDFFKGNGGDGINRGDGGADRLPGGLRYDTPYRVARKK